MKNIDIDQYWVVCKKIDTVYYEDTMALSSESAIRYFMSKRMGTWEAAQKRGWVTRLVRLRDMKGMRKYYE